MSEPKRVAVATFGRSDFSILRPLCRLLAEAPDFSMGMWVGGAHFEETSGHTVRDIEASGLPIWARIDGGESDRSQIATLRTMAAQLVGFGAVGLADEMAGVTLSGPVEQPDLVLVLGDRFEAVAAGLAMVPLGIPVGHISGGSITEGAIDDVFRHCLTKIAAIHFCDLPRFAQRIQYMGEPAERIITTGALGLDAFSAPQRGFDEFVERFDLTGLEPAYALATLHPESRRPELTRRMAEAMMSALDDFGGQVVVTYPNADPTADEIVDVIERAADGHVNVHCVRGFGADWYPTAMANADVMIGNSSGGILEAASFGLPVVDIGDRQKGRNHGPNVLHCGRDRPDILGALRSATARSFRTLAASGNVYGDGRGAERVIAALRSADWTDLAAPKRFADPDPEFTGERLVLP